MIALTFVSLSSFIWFLTIPSSSKPISTCETQQSCLDIIRRPFDNGLKVEVCLLFNPSISSQCIAGIADDDDQGSSDGSVESNDSVDSDEISLDYVCSSDSKSDKMDGFVANIEMCKTVDCGSNALFGIKDGRGCSQSNGLSDITISGVDGISCSSQSYCGGGAKKDCTWSIPAGNCPTPDPTSEPSNNPSAAPTDHPTREPTVNPTSNPSLNPSSNPTNDPTTASTTASPTPVSNNFVKEYVISSLDTYYYSLAKGWCESQGMQLATFDNGDDIRELYDLCQTGANAVNRCWLGFEDLYEDGLLRFSDDGEIVDTEAEGYWKDQEPNGPALFSCGAIIATESDQDVTTSLVDDYCVSRGYAICETIDDASNGDMTTTQVNLVGEYILTPQPFTYVEAATYCESEGMKLATFDNGDDIKELYDICASLERVIGSSSNRCWLGFDDLDDDGYLDFIDDGEIVDTEADGYWYNFYGSLQEPNGATPSETCGLIFTTRSNAVSKTKSLLDDSCDSSRYGICQSIDDDVISTTQVNFVKEYMATDQVFNWSDASDWCESEGMQLATFDNGDDIRDLYSICASLLVGTRRSIRCWLGFDDLDDDEQWDFIDDGEIVDTEADGYWYDYYGSFQEPNGATPSETCGQIFVFDDAAFGISKSLSDGRCDIPQYAICETIPDDDASNGVMTTTSVNFEKEYMATPQAFTWSEARDYCTSQDMQLATFSNGDDIKELYSICVESYIVFASCWLGFDDLDDDGNLDFIDDGENVVDTEADGYWYYYEYDGLQYDLEPNGAGTPSQTCGSIRTDGQKGPLTSLQDADCTNVFVAICETIPDDASNAAQMNDDEIHHDDGLKMNDDDNNGNNDNDKDKYHIMIIIGVCILFGLLVIGAISFGIYKVINCKSNGKASFPQQSTSNETEIELPPTSSVNNVI